MRKMVGRPEMTEVSDVMLPRNGISTGTLGFINECSESSG